MCWRSSGFNVMSGAHRLYGCGGSLARKASGAFPFQVRRHDCASDADTSVHVIILCVCKKVIYPTPRPEARNGCLIFSRDAQQDFGARTETFHFPSLITAGGQETFESLCKALVSSRGEASSVALARRVLDRYKEASPEEKDAIFAFIASHFVPQGAGIEKAAKDYL